MTTIWLEPLTLRPMSAASMFSPDGATRLVIAPVVTLFGAPWSTSSVSLVRTVKVPTWSSVMEPLSSTATGTSLTPLTVTTRLAVEVSPASPVSV